MRTGKRPAWLSSTALIFYGLGLGIVLGMLFPKEAYPGAYDAFRFKSKAFINLIKMLIVPLNFSTIVSGKNLAGQQILGDQTLTRQEMLWLATAANKWFIEEDDLGSIEIGNQGDLAVLDRDCFTVPDEDLKRTRSLLTVVGGKIVHEEML